MAVCGILSRELPVSHAIADTQLLLSLSLPLTKANTGKTDSIEKKNVNLLEYIFKKITHQL